MQVQATTLRLGLLSFALIILCIASAIVLSDSGADQPKSVQLMPSKAPTTHVEEAFTTTVSQAVANQAKVVLTNFVHKPAVLSLALMAVLVVAAAIVIVHVVHQSEPLDIPEEPIDLEDPEDLVEETPEEEPSTWGFGRILGYVKIAVAFILLSFIVVKVIEKVKPNLLWTSPLGDISYISYLKDAYVAPTQQQTDANTNNANQQGTDSSASSTTHPNGNPNNSGNNTNTVHTNNSNNSADGSGSDSNTGGNNNVTNGSNHVVQVGKSPKGLGTIFETLVTNEQNTSSQPHVQQGNDSNNSADGSGSDSNTSGNTNATIEINPSGSVLGAVVNQPQDTSSQPHVQQGTADQNTIFVQTPPKEQSYLNQSNSNQNVSEQNTTKPLHDSGLQAEDDIPIPETMFWI